MAELVEIMRTAFSARTFTDDPIDDGTIASILDDARFAPSGGNRQGWQVVVVRKPETKRALIDLGNRTIRVYVAQRDLGENPLNTIDPTAVDADAVRDDESIDVSWWESLADAPVLLVIGVDLRVVASVDAALDRVGVASGGSIYPFVHNILLGARARGLGSAVTTFVAGDEPAAQELLGFPSSTAIAAVMPLGVPTQVLTKLSRNPVESFARRERWDGEPLRADPS